MKALALILLLLIPLRISAAELPVGQWNGSYTFADDDSLWVKYRVERVESGETSELQITMLVAGVEIPFQQIQLNDSQLTFRMDPGEEVSCTLFMDEDGVYRGECLSTTSPDSEQKIMLFMRPPQTDEVDAEQPDTSEGMDEGDGEEEESEDSNEDQAAADQPT
ncbi:hypothetical protein SAMN02745165_01404 [Malonomonas rubra DSM 5091]|uniref:TIGR03067 domain-containing protein n=1 Tax=Malonomonas rubra DSM 5091 TaxID=1122189 RepID=A0A1M6G491_MALRU|nr:hypothetical protein [Malonomonas rubra]SHJ04801.1 hypothetical protein SAMN02745165_01404 [Malonomonas rubra DSM 5091]